MRPVSPPVWGGRDKKAHSPSEANPGVLAGRRADLAGDERQNKLCRSFDSQAAAFARSENGG